MNIILISEDDQLRKACSEVLSEICDFQWKFTAVTQPGYPQDADLYIWDNHWQTMWPSDYDWHSPKHLFILDPESFPRYLDGSSTPPRAVLLKPVTRECLSAFLGLAIAAAQERAAIVTSLRADRDEILQCLIQSNLYIQTHDRERSNFLARLVHDLETPLITANGYCGLLASEALGPQNEQQKEVLRRIQHSIKRLNGVASAMFQMSVGNMVKRGSELRRADIRECIEQALQEVAPLVDDKRISISVDVTPEFDRLFLKPGQIEQALVHILKSACKFTPKTGEITVRGYPFFWERRTDRPLAVLLERRVHRSQEPNSYRVDIRDSGARIPRENLTNLFEEASSHTGEMGRSDSGLGFAICKMILHAHEGRVWAENSEAGPRFSLVIPMRSRPETDTAEVKHLPAANIQLAN